MKIQNKIIPLSLILLFIVGIFGQTQQTSFSFNQDLLKQVQLAQDSGNQISNDYQPNYKTFSQVTSGRTTLTTDADTYAPGDWVTITAESDTDEMNGSLEWRVESPIKEVSFDFNSYYQDVFTDPEFEAGITTDWENDGFDFISAADGYLNITEEADLALTEIEIYNNNSALTTNDKYRVTFDYYPLGENMLLNPSFETGDTLNWDSVGTLENVSVIDDPANASDGSFYANINATTGFILNQTVPINGQSDGRSFTFTVRATGNTNLNYWRSRLEAINVSGDVIGVKTSEDSRTVEVDEKGYATVMFEWKLPANVTSVKAIFLGQDTGDDGYYTGWVDKCILAEAPAPLIFSYAADGEWNNNTLISDAQEWHTTEYIFETSATLPSPSTKTLRFILKDTNSYANNKTSYWLIDNIAVNLVTKHDEFADPITNVENNFEGYINSTWFHQGYREELSSTFKVDIETPENVTVASEAQAEIKFQLPTHQVYMGSWIFLFKIHQIDNGEPPALVQTQTINISFVVEEPLNFVTQDYYLLRGSTNKTVANESVYIEYFAQETNIDAISPGDNITILGYLEANSTPSEWYDLEYLEISGAFSTYQWESKWTSEEMINWNVFGLIPYNSDGKYIVDGNFTSPLNTTQTVGINFQVPDRGIFGNITGNISLNLIGSNVKPNGVGEPVLSLIVPITLPRIEFEINVTEEHLPSTSFYLTDYLGGNATIEFLNINNSLETNYPNRNISAVLDIPITDIDLRIFLEDTTNAPGVIVQEFHYHHIDNTIIWLDFINPNIESGTYTLGIRWDTPYSQNATSFAVVPITQLAIIIEGTLEIIPPSTTPTVKQGEQKTVNFTIELSETSKRIGGLNLISSLVSEDSVGNLIVYEQQGVYYIDLVVGQTMEAMNYEIQIFTSGNDISIGTIEFTVIKRDIPPPASNLFDILISVAGFGIFVGLGIAAAVLMFRLNKS